MVRGRPSGLLQSVGGLSAVVTGDDTVKLPDGKSDSYGRMKVCKHLYKLSISHENIYNRLLNCIIELLSITPLLRLFQLSIILREKKTIVSS